MENKPDLIGYVGVGISVLGAIAAVATNNPAIAPIPLAVGVGCNLVSRMQLSKELISAHTENQESINALKELLETNKEELNSTLTTNQDNLTKQIQQLQENVNNNLEQTKEKLENNIINLDTQIQQISDVVSNLRQVESFSQELRVEPQSADFYYQRAISLEHLDNKHGAIEDYSEAIKRDGNFAKAYHKRGVLHLELGNRQKAVDDLRKAALLYFEQGDIESYHQAREMSRNIHDLRANLNGSRPNMVVGEDLFSS
jgi:tetratricopeptide (TPR) repeat protein